MSTYSDERRFVMSICTAKAGETQPPTNSHSAEKMRSEAQYIVSECKERLRNLDRRFVLIAFEGGLISGKAAEAWLEQIDAGQSRRKGEIKSLIIEHYTAGKLSADNVAELFRLMELEAA